ncbi:uroporphyrinogen-III synthase [Erythrobacter sp. HKB08]|uniref:uroporphyrinogen-III synthase n=1 Tax=Erythrobacter sp. HKB08 TaxID=2502843 RepID=UPI0010088B06|nr:uroporphyrinogen-III synthase [Erythrobacter sp. HKB08]
MSEPVFVFRPEPGFSDTIERGKALGLAMTGQPLFRIEPVAWECGDSKGFDAILAGSANAFRHGGSQLDQLTQLPVLAVGEATAAAARDRGFEVELTGRGGLQALLDNLPKKPIRLLRLSGEDRVDLDIPGHISVAEVVVYRSAPQPLDQSTAGDLREGGVCLIHSGRALEQLGQEFDRLGIDRARLKLAVIGPRVAELAGPAWGKVAIAPTPDDASLLALARDLCNNG